MRFPVVKSWSAGSGVAALVLSAACVAPTFAEDDAAALKRLEREIAQTVGENGCGNVSFCRVIPMGHDLCGNPSRWLAFNNYPGVREVVETKAAEYTFIEEDMLRGKPRPADCKPAGKAKPACVNGRCSVGEISY
jgi:hypothetical protein